MSLISMLKKVSLFSEVPDEALEKLASSEVIVYAPGKLLVEQGAPGDSLYLVIEGNVSIQRDELEITQKGVGECIGEMALIDDAPRNASVVAIEPTKAVQITKDKFWDIIEAYPSIARHLLHVLCARIRQDTLRQVTAMQEKIRRERDLMLAAEIQQNMLPSGALEVKDLRISGACIPADTVGGDYFDYIVLPDGHVCCIIADGRGHGIDAALLVALIRSALHTQVRVDSSPESVMDALEQVVMDAAKGSGNYVTCCYVLFEDDQLHYVNAGHPYPILVRDGKISGLESTSLPLGWSYLDPSPFSAMTIEWSPGDELLMYSDGVIEAENLKEELFGFERLSGMTIENLNDLPDQLSQKILDALKTFRGGKPLLDDVTLVITRRHRS